MGFLGLRGIGPSIPYFIVPPKDVRLFVCIVNALNSTLIRYVTDYLEGNENHKRNLS